MKVSDSFEKLKAKGLIDYDSKLSRRDIEDVLEIEYEPDMKFIGPYLTLKQYIENEGYFCTSENCENGALRILAVGDMFNRAEKIQSLLMKKQKRTLNSMLGADVTVLSESERKRHEHANTRLILGMQALKSILNNI